MLLMLACHIDSEAPSGDAIHDIYLTDQSGVCLKWFHMTNISLRACEPFPYKIMENIMKTSSNENIFCIAGLLCGVPGEFPAQKLVTRRFDVFFICIWINGRVTNHQAGDLRRLRAHYDGNVMITYELRRPSVIYNSSNTFKQTVSISFNGW